MKKILLIAVALLAGLGAAVAQDVVVSGRVITAPYWDSGRMLLFSQPDYIYGTSRSASMGGAFTSLGADLSSININPAGLGMYQSSDWGITSALSIDKMRTSSEFMSPGALSQGGNRTTFGLNNLGAAYNVLRSSSGLTSLTIGFSYNRAANFNSRTIVNTTGEDASIVQMFQNQLNLIAGEGVVGYEDLEPSKDPFYNNYFRLDEWSAILGYQTGLVGRDGHGGYVGFDGSTPSDSYFGAVTRGGIYEYSFALGANVSNKLYLGATLGVTEINYKEETSYEEYYYQGARFSDMWFDQTTRISGAGLTAKFGAVVRPVPALRLGVAFHLPTYYTIDKSYRGVMGAGNVSANTDDPLVDEQRFNTAPRLLAGISAVIADRAIIAVDYEVAWYDKMRTRSEYFDEVEDSKADSQRFYKPGQTFRVGLEHAGDVFSVRLGGSYMMDFMRDNSFVTNNPAPRSGYSLTAGLGFNIGRNGYLDLAYVYNRTKWTNYDFFFYDDGEWIASQYDVVGGQDISREYTPHRNHHMITLTLGNRF